PAAGKFRRPMQWGFHHDGMRASHCMHPARDRVFLQSWKPVSFSMQDALFDDPPPPRATAGQQPTRAAVAARSLGVQPAPAQPRLVEIAGALPGLLRMGCSTWSYPGWEGLVWEGAYDASVLAKKGLTAYAQHPLLRSVCIDRSFWRPLTTGQY